MLELVEHADGLNPRQFKLAEMVLMTGLSERTVRYALDELEEKLSIEVRGPKFGSKHGVRYYVRNEKEILEARREVGMKIDPISKKVAEKRVDPAASNN